MPPTDASAGKSATVTFRGPVNDGPVVVLLPAAHPARKAATPTRAVCCRKTRRSIVRQPAQPEESRSVVCSISFSIVGGLRSDVEDGGIPARPILVFLVHR